MFSLILSISLLCFATAQVEQCSPANKLTWSTANGHILLNGQPFVLKGTAHYGFETSAYGIRDLTYFSLEPMIELLKTSGFNVLRLPFSMELVKLNPQHMNISCEKNPKICNMSSLNFMDWYIDRLGEEGILVMLDGHRLNKTEQSALWYNDEYPEEEVIRLWDQLLIRFASKWNLFAVDLHNEPHVPATWGMNDTTTDFNLYAERFITHMAQRHPFYKGLFFVEGVGTLNVCGCRHPFINASTYYPTGGQSLSGIHCAPIRNPNQALENRVVYSPHAYGPEETPSSAWNATNFPDNMPAIWQTFFGFAQQLTGHPVILGEWAWNATGSKGELWGREMSKWLKESCLTNQFWWCLNADGKYGLFNHGYTANAERLAFLHDVQPNPTKIAFRPPNVCVTPGSFVNPVC